MKKPSKDFSTRLATAKQWRSQIEPKIKEVYRFCAPGREDEFSKGSKYEPESEVYTSIGEEMAGDLGGDLVTYYTPAEATWFEYAVTAPIPEEMVDAVKEAVEQREADLRELLAQSNYNDTAPQWGAEAAMHGTPAIWVNMAHMSQPVHIEPVPPCELYVTPGHLGILDRFREKRVPTEALEAVLFGYDVDLKSERIQKKMKPGMTSDVMWGFWLDWSDPGRPMWKMEITVDGERVTPAEPVNLGDRSGACPLLVGRFNPRPGRPWGHGPGLKALPDLRVLDKVEEVVLTSLDDALLNTIIYPDDGFLDLSEGLEAGRAYPAQRGFTRDSIYELNKSAKLDYGFFTKDDLEGRIRQAFFQDGPRQRGETPPTAAQWFDEARRVQQRLGKPSAPLWTEMIYPLVQRIEFLGIMAGRLDPQITVDGQAITVEPISPLQKAQNRDQVMISRSNLELAAAASPEGPGVMVDLVATFKNIVKASGDDLTVIREEEQPVAQATAAPPQ